MKQITPTWLSYPHYRGPMRKEINPQLLHPIWTKPFTLPFSAPISEIVESAFARRATKI